MGDLGPVLELLHDAQPRWKTLRATGREWRHNLLGDEVSQRHFAAMQASRPAGATVQLTGYVPDDRQPQLPAESEESWRLWMEREGRKRSEFAAGEGSITVVFDGPTWWSWSPNGGAWTNGGMENHRHGSGPSEALIDTAALLSALGLQFLGNDTLRGRDVFRVRGLPRPRPRTDHDPDDGLYGLGVGADDYVLSVDAERGVLLRSEGRLREQPFMVIEMTEVEFDVDLPTETFVIDLPDGETFQGVTPQAKAYWPGRSRLQLGWRRHKRFPPRP